MAILNKLNQVGTNAIKSVSTKVPAAGTTSADSNSLSQMTASALANLQQALGNQAPADPSIKLKKTPASASILKHESKLLQTMPGDVYSIDNIGHVGFSALSLQQVESTVDASYLATRLSLLKCPDVVDYRPLTIVFTESGLGTSTDVPFGPDDKPREFQKFNLSDKNFAKGTACIGVLIKARRYNEFFGTTSLTVSGPVSNATMSLISGQEEGRFVMLAHETNKILKSFVNSSQSSVFVDTEIPGLAPQSAMEDRALTSTIMPRIKDNLSESSDVSLCTISAQNLTLWVYPIILTKELANKYLSLLSDRSLGCLADTLLNFI